VRARKRLKVSGVSGDPRGRTEGVVESEQKYTNGKRGGWQRAIDHIGGKWEDAQHSTTLLWCATVLCASFSLHRKITHEHGESH
jgi:hypothetical protein